MVQTDARFGLFILFLVWYKLFFVDYENTVKKYNHVQPEVASLLASGKLV